MRTWKSLQTKLEELFDSKNVYYQPPENLKMGYPAIRYSLSDIESLKADDTLYVGFRGYDVVVIDKNPENPVIEKLLALPNSSYDRHYVNDNLYHDIIKIYY